MGVDQVIGSYSGKVAARLQELRELIHDVANTTDGVGEIEECLKWGQPSFVTKRPKSGSTVRIDAIKDDPSKVAMYFICSTSLVDQFRELYPDILFFQGNRAILFNIDSEIPVAETRHCVAMALTYHL